MLPMLTQLSMLFYVLVSFRCAGAEIWMLLVLYVEVQESRKHVYIVSYDVNAGRFSCDVRKLSPGCRFMERQRLPSGCAYLRTTFAIYSL